MTDPIGPVVAGKYRIRRRIGRGGFGAVYEAEHIEIGRRVAIKTIDKEFARDEERVARFRREAHAAGSIESDHIVHVFDIGDDPELGLYMVMELLVGEDLAGKLERVGKLEVEHAVDFAHQAARGLARAHAAGVVHRDLKPANLFLVSLEESTRARVKIVDFGVSKLMPTRGGPEIEAITRAGVTMGTPQYMAPEQVFGGVIDRRVDVWALGAVLYEMLAGRPAYPLLDTYEQTFMSIALGPPRPLNKAAPHVPDELVAVVGRALQHDLDLRFPDCESFADALVEAVPTMFPESARPKKKKRATASGTPRTSDSMSTSSRAVVAAIERRQRRLRVIVVSTMAFAGAVAGAALIAQLAGRSGDVREPTLDRADMTISSGKTSLSASVVKPPTPALEALSDASEPSASTHPSVVASTPKPVVKLAPPATSATTPIEKPPAPPSPTPFGAAGISSSY